MKKKLLIPVLIGAVAISGCNSDSGSDASAGDVNYPNGNIEVVVGWGAGGGSDVFARAIARELGEELGVNVNVVNQPGSSGAIAGDYVLNQPADGQTLWAMTSNYALNVAAGITNHTIDEYTPIGRVQEDTLALQVNTQGDYQSFDELIEAGISNSGQVSVAGTGALGWDEMMLASLERDTGAEFNYIPYEDAGEMHASVVGGHTDAMLEELGPTSSQVESGQIAPIIIFSDTTIEGFEDVPITAEVGLEELTGGMNRGIFVHGDTDDEIVDILEGALESAKDKEAYLEYEQNNYLHLRDGWLDGPSFAESISADIEIAERFVNER